MKMTSKNTSQTTEQPVFHKVAENLYRFESSDGYYALLKRGGKQFRRSLKTKDRKLADRRLNDLRTKIGCLKIFSRYEIEFRAGRESVAGNEQTRIEFQYRQTPENVYQGTHAVFSESANPQHHPTELRPLGYGTRRGARFRNFRSRVGRYENGF